MRWGFWRGGSMAIAMAMAVGPSPAAAMVPPIFQRLGDLNSILNLPRLAGLFEAPIERIELVGPGLYRLTAGRCHMEIRMIVVRGGPGEGLAPPRTEPRPGPRICEP